MTGAGRARGIPGGGRPSWPRGAEPAVGIWGRAEAGRPAGHLNVLVWRVRRELQGAGFDPWCLEKRRRYLRARVERVTLA